MKGGVVRMIAFGFLAFTFMYFMVFRQASSQVDHADAVLMAVSAQFSAQQQIIAVGPRVAAADGALKLRLAALRAKCAPRCSQVYSVANEVAAVRVVARSAGVQILGRTFHTDGTVDIITRSTQAGALRFLDDLQRLPAPIRMTKTVFTAQDGKVKMELNGAVASGAAV